MMKALKALPVPQPDYGKVLFWVLNANRFSTEVMRKIGVWSPLVAPGSALGAAGLQAAKVIRRRWPRHNHSWFSITESSVEEWGSDLDRFLSEKRGEKPLLWAKRTPEIMKWHFCPPQNRRITKVLSCRKENEILGYAIVRMDPPNSPGLRRALLADLQIRQDDPGVLGSLLAAGVATAKKADCDVFEVIGFPESIRRGLELWRPYSRYYPECPFFYKARGTELQQAMANKEFWYASPFDGDGTLWP
jgi:hypothetical protein